jgi:hypothetical protein
MGDDRVERLRQRTIFEARRQGHLQVLATLEAMGQGGVPTGGVECFMGFEALSEPLRHVDWPRHFCPTTLAHFNVIRINVIRRGFGPIFHGDQKNSKITTRELDLRQIKSNPLELLTLKLTGINSHAWYNIRSRRSANKRTDMRPQTLGLFWSLSELENNKSPRYKAAAITLYG